MIISLKRIFRYALRNFFRNGGSAMATIFVMIMAISVVTSLFLFRNISQFVISDIQDKVDLAVYFKKSVSEEEILEIKREIAALPETKKVDYVSREAALVKFIERYKDNPVLMQSLDEVGQNPFMASLGVSAFEASQYQAVVSFLENADFKDTIEKVDFFQRKTVIDRIAAISSNLNLIGVILSVILVFVAGVVAYNTIRLAIYNSREEIKIQRLVGAGNWFIRGPFLFEGIISGVLAAFVCLAVFFVAFWLLSSKIDNLYPSLNLFHFFLSSFWQIFLIQTATGVILGAVSSWLAIRKFMRV